MGSEPDIMSSETTEQSEKCKVSVCNKTALLCPGHAVEEPPVFTTVDYYNDYIKTIGLVGY